MNNYPLAKNYNLISTLRLLVFTHFHQEIVRSLRNIRVYIHVLFSGFDRVTGGLRPGFRCTNNANLCNFSCQGGSRI